jgi:hypothetical protein
MAQASSGGAIGSGLSAPIAAVRKAYQMIGPSPWRASSACWVTIAAG